MTPSEKAKQLIEMYVEYCHDGSGFDSGGDSVILKENAKQCALIAVDFHLKEFEDWATSVICAEDFSYKYWQEVKEEINKL